MFNFPVQKRFGNETVDIREFIRPNSIGVQSIFNEYKDLNIIDFINYTWDWVLTNISYPLFTENTLEISDRHVLEAYVNPLNMGKTIRNVLVSGTVSGIARKMLTGNLYGSLFKIARDAFIGNGLLILIESALNNTIQNISPLLKYETLDFWNYPSETIRDMVGDCEDTSFLLTSILRNKLSENDVYATVGTFDGFGHSWVTIRNIFNEDKILETTGDNVLEVFQSDNINSPYKPIIHFNDKQVLIIDKDQEYIIHSNKKIYEKQKLISLKQYWE